MPGKTFVVSRRSRPASGFSHRVVVRDRQPRRMPAAPPMARNGRCSGRRSQPGAQQRRLGQSADLDGPCRRHPRRHPPLQRNICARRRRPGRRRGKPVSRLDRFLGNARARSDDATRLSRRSNSTRRAPISATRCVSTPTGRWCCRATPATAGNRSANRRRIITASRISRRRAASPSTTSRSRSPDRPGWTANGAASRWPRTRPDGTGSRCILTSGEKLMLYRMRQTDGNHYCSGNWIGPRRQVRAARLRRHRHDADGFDRDRGPQDADRMAHRHSRARRSRSNATPLNRAEAGWGRAFPIGKDRSALRGSHSGVGYLEMTGY